MEKTILIINKNQPIQISLTKSLVNLMPNYRFEGYSIKADMLYAIENRFYTLVVLGTGNLDMAVKIFELNPIAKVIVLSENGSENFPGIKSIVRNLKVLEFIDQQEKIAITVDLLIPIISDYYDGISNDISNINTSLLRYYSEAKNETDINKKGILFERFISLLFGFLGYREITRRIVDSSRNEVDLSIRNEIKDSFLNKFGKYILLECKNKPNYKVSKNDFIVFNNKLKNSNGLSELGIIATTGGFAKTIYQEAMRESGTNSKILFLSNVEFLKLIQSDNKLEEFKKIIDEQMKSN